MDINTFMFCVLGSDTENEQDEFGDERPDGECQENDDGPDDGPATDDDGTPDEGPDDGRCIKKTIKLNLKKLN